MSAAYFWLRQKWSAVSFAAVFSLFWRQLFLFFFDAAYCRRLYFSYGPKQKQQKKSIWAVIKIEAVKIFPFLMGGQKQRDAETKEMKPAQNKCNRGKYFRPDRKENKKRMAENIICCR